MTINQNLPMINGQTYDWNSITCLIAGIPVMGITAIKYGDKQETKNNYGAGRQPVSYSKGRITASASMTLYMEEVEALQAAAPGGRLHDLAPFDIVVAYLPPNGIVVTHVIKGCRFSTNDRDWKEGDMAGTVPFELNPSQIKWK